MSRRLRFIETSWGILAAVWSDQGLFELTFPHPTEADARKKLITTGLEPDKDDDLAWRHTLTLELRSFFSGVPTAFSVPVDWSGYTPFRLKALQYITRIPFGLAESYGEVAVAIGNPKAMRAVGGAMHANRTPIVVPCHRVVGSDGSLTGFGGGLDLKKKLLLLEKPDGWQRG